MRTIGLIANHGKADATPMARLVVGLARRRRIRVLADAQTGRLTGLKKPVDVEEMARLSDLIVVLGGDGTMLLAARQIKGSQTPLLGVNLGGLGFLTAISADKARRQIPQVLAGSYTCSPRSQIEVRVVRGDRTIFTSRGLNEAVVGRGRLLRTLKIRLSIDGREVTTYAGDGLIIATPTGSTAYSLSGGGPICSPEADVMVVTPICPHTLTNRSLVVGDRSSISALMLDRDRDMVVTVDGQDQIPLEGGDNVHFSLAETKVQLAKLKDHSFYDLLRHKLNWRGSYL